MRQAQRANADSAELPYAHHSISASDVEGVLQALLSGRIAQGPRTRCFERALAGKTGTRHALAVSSGTAALHTALAALEVGPGDEVIVPTLTFAATANAVALCGATPRFADVDPTTLTLDPEEVRRLLCARTRGAIAVHYGGHAADTVAIAAALGDQRFLLEDACHALGGRLGGRRVGSLATAACFSFHPAKAITTGEGGAITTDSRELLERLALFREHGIERRAQRFEGLGLPAELRAEAGGAWVYEQQELGSNYRISELGAALGLSQLERLQAFIERRRKLAEAYCSALSDLELVRLPEERAGVQSAWHLFPVRLRVEMLRGGRAAAFAALRARGLGVQVHYIPMHLQPYYRERQGTAYGDFPVAEDAYLRLLSLPLFPDLEDEEQGRVVEIVRAELLRLRR